MRENHTTSIVYDEGKNSHGELLLLEGIHKLLYCKVDRFSEIVKGLQLIVEAAEKPIKESIKMKSKFIDIVKAMLPHKDPVNPELYEKGEKELIGGVETYLQSHIDNNVDKRRLALEEIENGLTDMAYSYKELPLPQAK